MNMNVYMHSDHMLYLQHSRPCCIGYTISRLLLELVYPIQHGRSCCKYYIVSKFCREDGDTLDDFKRRFF